jgi:hypothetical protein
VRGPVRSLARGAAVQCGLASRALLGPFAAFVIRARLARRVVASSGALLEGLGVFVEDGVVSLYLVLVSMATQD